MVVNTESGLEDVGRVRPHTWASRNSRGSTVVRLARRGSIQQEELLAAVELERCIRGSGVGPKVKQLDWVKGGTGDRGNGNERQVIGQIDQQDVLARWTKRLRSELKGRDALRVTVAVVMGDRLSHLDQAYQHRNGWARRRLAEGLEAFTAIKKKGLDKGR